MSSSLPTEIQAAEAQVAPRVQSLQAAAAEVLIVTDAAGESAAVAMMRDGKRLLNEADDVFGPIVRAAHEAHRVAVAQRERVKAPIQEVVTLLGEGVQRYRAHLEAERRAAEAIARQQAEDARRVAQAEAERVRAAEAEKLAAAGHPEIAEQVRAAPLPPPPTPTIVPSAPPVPPPPPGLRQRTTYSARVVDPMALARAVVAGTVPADAIQPNTRVLNAAARALRESFAWPGCELVEESNVSVVR